MATLRAERRKIVRIAVGSPNDLQEERRRFRDVIYEVNEIKAASLGMQLEAVGWENILPGRGRPQSLINMEIEHSDLFVLLFWRKWGTPSGSYSSGTEEEFEVARSANTRSGGHPDIWLYFRSVSSEMLADPGDQLSKLLAFKRRIEEDRSFLYRTYDLPETWEKDFRRHLALWLDRYRAGPAVSGARALRGKIRPLGS